MSFNQIQRPFCGRLLVVFLAVLTSLGALPGISSPAFTKNFKSPGPIAGPAASGTISSSSLTKPDQATQERLLEAYGKLPLSFEANQGQADGQVKFLSRGNGYNLFLTSNEAVLELRVAEFGLRNERISDFKRNNPQSTIRNPQSGNPQLAVLRMQFVGANPEPKVYGFEETESKSNYFIGRDTEKWRTNIPNYARVRFQKVYPGVDVVYYGNQSQLEYDFIVAPGADPYAITLNFEGADRLEIDAQGDLVLHTAGGEIRQHKPVLYQEVDGTRQPVSGDYFLKEGQRVGFQVAGYDPSRPLVIDPVLSYSTYLGGSGTGGGGNDQGFAIATDSAGNAYVTGFTDSFDFPLARPLQPFSFGGTDAFVTKLNASGSAIVYSTYLGGSDDDEGRGIAVDSSGNAYVTGFTYSNDFPTANPLQAVLGSPGLEDVFVAKLNGAGSALVYSTYLGGNDSDIGESIAVDSAGNAYVTGQTFSTNFPTKNPLQINNGEHAFSDAFVAKLNTAGSSLVYSTYLGGSSDEFGSSIAVDSGGNAYVTGFTNSTDFPTMNPLQGANGGGYSDAFVSKLNAAGSALVYSTYLGGSSFDEGLGIAVDSGGNAYVTGYTTSANFPTANALQPVLNFGGDAFVTKLNAAGSALVYSTYLGGSNFDNGYGIAVDSNGNAYVTGSTSSYDFPMVNALQPFNKGNGDAFVAKLNAAGSALVYSTYLGGSNFDNGYGIAVDSNGNAYVTGNTASRDFLTFTPVQAAFRGVTDAFVTKLDTTGSSMIYSTYLGGTNGNDSGNGIAIDSLGNAYIVGNTLSVDFPTVNSKQGFNRGLQDVFVAKLNVAGSALVYSTYFGGSFFDTGTSIAVDSAGNAYITGFTSSNDFPVEKALQYFNNFGDAFVTKLSTTGGLIYSTFLGGSNFDRGNGIAVDSAGNAYVTGFTFSADFPNALRPYGGNGDAFVAELNAAGTALVYSTYIGGSDFDQANGIAIDSAGNAYVTGSTSSANFLTVNALQPAIRGSLDAFVAKLSPLGRTLVYSTYLGGSNFDQGNAVAVDSAGNAYVTGFTSSTNFPTMNPLQSANKGFQNSFVAKLNATGTALVYSTYLGGGYFDQGNGIAVDTAGNAYVTGQTYSIDFPTAVPIQASNGGLSNAFVTKLNATGTALVYSTYLGGGYFDQGNGIAVDTAGNGYVTGQTFSINFPTANPLQAANRGASDVFVTKISPAGGLPTITGFNPAGAPVGATVAISGTGFTGASKVQFNGVNAIFNVLSAASISATVPVGATTGKVSVTAPTGVGTSGTVFKVSPKIVGFSPSDGLVGDMVTVTGTNFTGVTSVKFGTISATIKSATDTQIMVTVPASAATGKISVTTPDGTSMSAADFTLLRTPIISSFSPLGGAPVGASVMLTGSNFVDLTDVRFNGISSNPFVVLSPTSIKVNVPMGATNGPISVTNRAGTGTSIAIFKVLPSITNFTPASGLAGDMVAITGANLSNPTAVGFGSVSAKIISATDTQIKVEVPAAATNGKISVTTADGMGISAADFTLIKSPTVASFTPGMGAVGTGVTIFGTNFNVITDVQFNGVSITSPITILSPTSIKVNVPMGATTGKITLANRAGAGASAVLFKVLPKVASLTPDSGLPGDTVTITGSNLNNPVAVRFGAITAKIISASYNEIKVTVPADGGTAKIFVTTADGSTAISETDFTMIKPPAVTSFTPISGHVGTSVTISGINISTVTDVQFNGLSVTSPITVLSPILIKVTIPAGATTGKISVVNRAGTATSAGTFTITQ